MIDIPRAPATGDGDDGPGRKDDAAGRNGGRDTVRIICDGSAVSGPLSFG